MILFGFDPIFIKKNWKKCVKILKSGIKVIFLSDRTRGESFLSGGTLGRLWKFEKLKLHWERLEQKHIIPSLPTNIPYHPKSTHQLWINRWLYSQFVNLTPFPFLITNFESNLNHALSRQTGTTSKASIFRIRRFG